MIGWGIGGILVIASMVMMGMYADGAYGDGAYANGSYADNGHISPPSSCAPPSSCTPPCAKLEGHIAPGGYLRIHTDKSAHVFHNGHPVVTHDGFALIAFAHDAKGKVDLRIECRENKLQWQWTLSERSYAVQHVTLPKNQVTPPQHVWQRITREAKQMQQARNQQDSFSAVPPRQFLLPTDGVFSGFYGSRRILNGEEKRPHFGLDIAASRGTLVVAPAPGIVVLKADMFYNGKTVVMQHGGGLNSVYTHLEHIRVVDGQYLDAGDPIGDVGSTGRSTGPHLHWGISFGTTPLDPQFFLKPPQPVNRLVGN